MTTDLTRLLADTLIDVTNPFGAKGTEHDAAKRMHAALVAVAERITTARTTDLDNAFDQGYLDALIDVEGLITTALDAQPRPPTYHEALAASGGLLNAPDGNGCDHRWRTFRDDGVLYGACTRCAQRCLACPHGRVTSRILEIKGVVCRTCGTDYSAVEVPRG